MCGICCILGEKNHSIVNTQDYVSNNSRLYNRGPDCQSRVEFSPPGGDTLVLSGCVLGLREPLTPQPLQDIDGNTLLWNGEIFGGLEVPLGSNDTEILLKSLRECESEEDLLKLLTTIQGPYAIIYWQASSGTLYFGRDVLGRRSLLWHIPESSEDVFVLSSVQVKPLAFKEVPAVGIFSLKLTKDKKEMGITVFPWQPQDQSTSKCDVLSTKDSKTITDHLEKSYPVLFDKSIPCKVGHFSIRSPLSSVKKTLPTESAIPELDNKEATDYLINLLENDYNFSKLTSQLIDVLQKAVKIRLNSIPRKKQESKKPVCCASRNVLTNTEDSSVLNIGKSENDNTKCNADNFDCNMPLPEALPNTQLVKGDSNSTENFVDYPDESNFSSGIESKATVAILFSGGLDSTVLAALADRCIPEDQPIDLLNVAFQQKPKQQQQHKGKPRQRGDEERQDPFNVPDRQTGLTALTELNPKRKWNFIEVNVTLEELKHYRTDCVSELLYPLCTVLDDSIGCAVWFAARGVGTVKSAGGSDLPFTSQARVILTGMGADEQLAGYSRHRTRFQSEGWEGLVDEIEMEVNRISTRNLGRDDRIITDHGRESRLPFLDENVVCFLNEIPVYLKADLTLPRGLGEKLLLRLCAVRLGLPLTAVAPKRAIQFGSRIAKAENRKENASDLCDRLSATVSGQ